MEDRCFGGWVFGSRRSSARYLILLTGAACGQRPVRSEGISEWGRAAPCSGRCLLTLNCQYQILLITRSLLKSRRTRQGYSDKPCLARARRWPTVSSNWKDSDEFFNYAKTDTYIIERLTRITYHSNITECSLQAAVPVTAQLLRYMPSADISAAKTRAESLGIYSTLLCPGPMAIATRGM